MNTNQYQNLKSKLEQAKSDADRAAGRLQQLMTELKKQYGVTTIGEAKKLLAKLEQEEKEASQQVEEAMAQYEKDFEGYDS